MLILKQFMFLFLKKCYFFYFTPIIISHPLQLHHHYPLTHTHKGISFYDFWVRRKFLSLDLVPYSVHYYSQLFSIKGKLTFKRLGISINQNYTAVLLWEKEEETHLSSTKQLYTNKLLSPVCYKRQLSMEYRYQEIINTINLNILNVMFKITLRALANVDQWLER